MDLIYIIPIVIILVIILFIIFLITNNKTNKTPIEINQKEPIEKSIKEKDDIKINQYEKKHFLTRSEKHFLSILNELTKDNLIIIPQINLATIIQKKGEFYYQNELYRNIDFGVFDKNYNVLLLIELNDITHQQNKRWERDKKVKNIVEQANIKLITFYTDKPNKPEYVIGRILKEINTYKEETKKNQIKTDVKSEEKIADHNI